MTIRSDSALAILALLALAAPVGVHAQQADEFGATTSEPIAGGNDQYIPSPEDAVPNRTQPAPPPASRTTGPQTPGAGQGHPPSPGGVFYTDCPQVWAMGRAPLRRGDAGYRPGLDPDGDGIACPPIG